MVCPVCGSENPARAEVCFTCRALLAAITRGTLIGSRYVVLSLLGRGAMGTVYEARDRILDEIVALKVLRCDDNEPPDLARRFRSEIKLARRVTHPNVCRIYDYGEDASLRYISMERVDGLDLKSLLRRDGPLAGSVACRVALQLAEGLDAVHRVGIVHRDLKSQNVMLDAHGEVKLMDFGLAKSWLNEGSDGRPGYVVGTPEYMSPEQARGESVDLRGDIYSLGVVWFEIFTGMVPFRGSTPAATLLLQIQAPPPLDGPEADAIPACVVPLLRRALAKRAADRFPNAHAMAQALAEAIDDPALALPLRADPTRLHARGSPVPTLSLPAAAPAPGPRARVAALLAAVFVVVALAAELSRRWPHATERARVNARAPALDNAPKARPPSAAPATRDVSTRRPAGSRRVAPAADPAARTDAAAAADPASYPEAPPLSAEPSELAPLPLPIAVAEAPGRLQIGVRPWSEILVDGESVGTTPLGALSLSAGEHTVEFRNPDYLPLKRRITVRPSETTKLFLDLPSDAIRRPGL